MRLFISFSVLLVAVRMANAEPLRIQDREFLEERKGQTVVASVRYKAITNEITSLRNAKPHIRLDDISTFIVRTSAEALLKAADWEPTERIEIIDDDVANRVSSLLTAENQPLWQQYLQFRRSQYQPRCPAGKVWHQSDCR